MSKSTIISSYNIVFCEEMFHSNKVLHNVLIYVTEHRFYAEIVTDLTTRNSEPKEPYGHNMTTQKLKRRAELFSPAGVLT
jgi:hypothetical protein